MGPHGEGRPRKYATNAEKQKAYRKRKQLLTPAQAEAMEILEWDQGQWCTPWGVARHTLTSLVRRGLADKNAQSQYRATGLHFDKAI